MPMPKREPLKKVCVVCGETFLCGGRGRPRVTQQMCSLKCQQVSRFRRGTLAAHLSVPKAAYLAGLVDGEGSIMLITRPAQSVHIRLTISNTDRALLDWVMETCDVGAIYQHREGTAQHKASYSWRCHGDGAESLIEQMLPYLLVKREQAELALDLHAKLRIPALKADRSWQQEYRLRMKELNRRGGVVEAG